MRAKRGAFQLLPVIAIIGFSVFLVVTIALHFIQPDYDPSRRFVSELVLGKYGWLLNVAIIGNLIGCFAFTLGFYYIFHKIQKSRICLFCLIIATLSVLTNFFPTDIHGKAITFSGHIHNIGAFIGTLAIFPVMTIFSLNLKKVGVPQSIFMSLVMLAFLAPVAFAGLFIIVNNAPDLLGISQRIYVIIIMSWLILASFRLKVLAFKPIKSRIK